MTRAGLPFRPFIITTKQCLASLMPAGASGGLTDQVRSAMHELERRTHKASVTRRIRCSSGAQRRSHPMPGMMDTVLNLD